MVNTDSVGPIPSPATNIQKNSAGYSVSARSWVIRAMPAVIETRAARMIALYFPVRDTRAPATIELPISPINIGKIRYPELVADSCRTACSQRGRKMIAPKKPKLTRNVERIDEA